MNILFVSDENLNKSVVYDIHILAEGLSLLEHEVYLIGFQRQENLYSRTRESRMRRVFSKSKAKSISIGFFNVPFIGSLFGFFNGYRAIQKIIVEKKIDAIVLYSTICVGLPSIKLSEKFNIPMVFRHIDMLHCLMPSSIKQKIVKFLERIVYPKADKILTLSPKYAEYLISHGADESKIKQLPFPVDTTLFRPGIDSSEISRKWRIDDKDEVIVFIGNLYNFSGLADFVLEFPNVIKKCPKAKLLIVGDGNLRLKLDHIISELRIEDNVIITGWQPFQTMPQYVNIAKVCINPFSISGIMKDLFCAKIVQYMACGKVTVSSALPGLTTVLPSESCGVVYVNNAKDMAEEVISLLKSPEARNCLGQAGFSYAQKFYNQDKLIRQLEEHLIEIINEKNRQI